MKKVTLILLITSIIVSCNDSHPVVRTSKADTIKTLLLFKSPDGKGLRYDIGYRVIKDSLKLISIDSSTFKRKWVRDTVFFVPYTFQLKDSANVPKVDSTGKPVMNLVYLHAPGSAIYIDGGKDIDSILKTLPVDTTMKK